MKSNFFASRLAPLAAISGSLLIYARNTTLFADQGWEGQALSFTWENDGAARSDRHYTQGAAISYWSADNSLARWLERSLACIPALGLRPEATKFGLAVSQEIYTPEDLDATDVVLDDRPYAGWLFGSFRLQRRGPGPGRLLAMETFRLDLGVVGPAALAEETQKEWHGDDPKGWDNQLENEPGVVLRYNRRFLYAHPLAETSWSLHLIPYADANLGNVDTSFGAGGQCRFGYAVPNEFEASAQRTPTKFGGYLFGGFEGRWVLHNIFLDGNTVALSHNVDREPLVGEAKVGLTLVLKPVEITASFTFRSKDFAGQDGNDSFGAATVIFKF